MGRSLRCGWGRGFGRRPGTDATVGEVGELLLDDVGLTVAADDACLLPVADVAYLAVVAVVPCQRRREDARQPDFAVGDGFDHLVRSDRGLVPKWGAGAASGVASGAGLLGGMNAVVDFAGSSPGVDGAGIGAESTRHPLTG